MYNHYCSSGDALQVVFGHFDVVTCICRSEVNMMHDCFIVTGSKDCTCMIWQFIGQKRQIYSDQLSKSNNPTLILNLAYILNPAQIYKLVCPQSNLNQAHVSQPYAYISKSHHNPKPPLCVNPSVYNHAKF